MTKPKAKGRPSSYRQTVADEICERLMRGESLRSVCRGAGMPDSATVFRWLANPEHELFREQYARARETQAETLADEITDIADEADAATIRGIEHARLRIDARKWVAARLLPKKYGDKVTQEITGKDGGALHVKSESSDLLRNLTDEQLAQLEGIAAAVAGSAGGSGGAGAA